jgi:hypothetical protein
MVRLRTMMAALFTVMLLAGLATPPSTAQQQQQQQGLVNVQVGNIKTGDILSNNNVELAAAVNTAVNVCGTTVNAAIISDQLTRTGSFRCEGATQFVRITQVAK